MAYAKGAERGNGAKECCAALGCGRWGAEGGASLWRLAPLAQAVLDPLGRKRASGGTTSTMEELDPHWSLPPA